MQNTTLSAKTLVFLTIAIIVLATGAKVFASNENSNKEAEARETHTVQSQNTENDSDNDNISSAISVTGVLTEDECRINARNHGAYVSCIAKLHLGGKRVSTAAKSDIGKKDHDNDDKVSPTITPSESPTETPSVTVTPEVTATVTLQAQIQQLIDLIKHLLEAIHL